MAAKSHRVDMCTAYKNMRSKLLLIFSAAGHAGPYTCEVVHEEMKKCLANFSKHVKRRNEQAKGKKRIVKNKRKTKMKVETSSVQGVRLKPETRSATARRRRRRVRSPAKSSGTLCGKNDGQVLRSGKKVCEKKNRKCRASSSSSNTSGEIYDGTEEETSDQGSYASEINELTDCEETEPEITDSDEETDSNIKFREPEEGERRKLSGTEDEDDSGVSESENPGRRSRGNQDSDLSSQKKKRRRVMLLSSSEDTTELPEEVINGEQEGLQKRNTVTAGSTENNATTSGSEAVLDSVPESGSLDPSLMAPQTLSTSSISSAQDNVEEIEAVVADIRNFPSQCQIKVESESNLIEESLVETAEEMHTARKRKVGLSSAIFADQTEDMEEDCMVVHRDNSPSENIPLDHEITVKVEPMSDLPEDTVEMNTVSPLNDEAQGAETTYSIVPLEKNLGGATYAFVDVETEMVQPTRSSSDTGNLYRRDNGTCLNDEQMQGTLRGASPDIPTFESVYNLAEKLREDFRQGGYVDPISHEESFSQAQAPPQDNPATAATHPLTEAPSHSNEISVCDSATNEASRTVENGSQSNRPNNVKATVPSKSKSQLRIPLPDRSICGETSTGLKYRIPKLSRRSNVLTNSRTEESVSSPNSTATIPADPSTSKSYSKPKGSTRSNSQSSGSSRRSSHDGQRRYYGNLDSSSTHRRASVDEQSVSYDQIHVRQHEEQRFNARVRQDFNVAASRSRGRSNTSARTSQSRPCVFNWSNRSGSANNFMRGGRARWRGVRRAHNYEDRASQGAGFDWRVSRSASHRYDHHRGAPSFTRGHSPRGNQQQYSPQQSSRGPNRGRSPSFDSAPDPSHLFFDRKK